ncbi:MAG: class I adenylate-forming enzyme family protein [Aureispira sp.]
MALPIKALYQANLATPAGLFRFSRALLRQGSNLMVLLEVAAKTQGERIAIAEANQTTTYTELYQQSLQLAAQWQLQGLGPDQNIGLMGRNHRHFVVSLFALSALGASCFLLPTGLPLEPFKVLLKQKKLQGLVYDLKDWEIVYQAGFDGQRWLFEHLTLPNVQALLERPLPSNFKLPRVAAGQLVTLSGGTTGIPQSSSRRPALRQFLAPFFALLRQLKLQEYNSTYIATPLYHGFGLAALLTSVALGATITLVPKFDKNTIVRLLLQQKIQVWVTVPTILRRLIDSNKLELIYTRLILSGGAPLSPILVEQVQGKGNIQLANLYGTSEAGFCVLANGDDLKKYPSTIGKAIKGAKLRLTDEAGQVVPTGTIGQLQVQTAWRAKQAEDAWVNTDDWASQNEEGYYFLQGRQSDRIVSGGLNVYPLVVQQLLETHPAIQQAAVIGIPDEEFGERLAAYLVLSTTTNASLKELRTWFQQKASKEQQPKQWYLLEQLPYTPVGKIDKKALTKDP